jgi:hypothetical protein
MVPKYMNHAFIEKTMFIELREVTLGTKRKVTPFININSIR